jgi:hypothetical protein
MAVSVWTRQIAARAPHAGAIVCQEVRQALGKLIGSGWQGYPLRAYSAILDGPGVEGRDDR